MSLNRASGGRRGFHVWQSNYGSGMLSCSGFTPASPRRSARFGVHSRLWKNLPPNTLDSDEQRNGETALANAFLAWLHDDATRAAKARDFMDRLSDHYGTHEDIDLNIRMPGIAMGYTFALDLLLGADLIPEDEAQAIEDELTTIMTGFFDEYVLDDIQRLWWSINSSRPVGFSRSYRKNNERTVCESPLRVQLKSIASISSAMINLVSRSSA